MKKRILFIINPISGTRRKKRMPDEIERHLDHSRYEHEVRFTTHAGHAAEMTAEAAKDGVDVVVAVGGDGTVNEVARSLVHTSTALGIIPCGSGNGLARHLQIPQNAKGAIEIINQGVIHCLDYGKINGRPFFCTCGMGFDAFVSKKFAESGKRGLIQYARNTIGVGLTYKPETYTITDENGTRTQEAFLIACAIASQYGNNAYIAPTASMKDGLMDVIILDPFNTIEGAHVLLQMFTKTILSNNHAHLYKSRHLHVTREKEGAVHCDGDPVMMGREIDVELVPRSFNVVVNPQAHDKHKNYLQELSENMERIFSPDSDRKHKEPAADTFNLQRFVDAQQGIYERAFDEISHGRKLTHWMWFIFPQMKGLGHSAMSKHYGIQSREEAVAYLQHPVLGKRLADISRVLLNLDSTSATEVFGRPDDKKLQSSMTLFSSILEEGNVFERVLIKYFEGRPCKRTLMMLEG